MRDTKEMMRQFWRILGVLGLVAVSVCIAIGLWLHFNMVDDTVSEMPPEVSDEVVEDKPVKKEETVPVLNQESMVSCYRVVLSSCSDIGTKCYFKGNVFGSDVESTFYATGNSILLSISDDGDLAVVPPSEVPMGSLVTIYTYDIAGHGQMEIVALLIGTETSGYSIGKFARVEERTIVRDDEESNVVIWLMSNSLDVVCVSDAVIRNGYTGGVYSSLNKPNSGDYFLYTRSSDFDILEDGNMYYAESVIVLGLSA